LIEEIAMADSLWDMLSAVGTVAAVFVALGISGQTALANRRVEKDRAELAAAKLLSPISAIESKASYLFAFFCFNKVEPDTQYMNALMAIQELDVMARSISIDDLYPLLNLKGHAAKRASRALGLIHSFCADANSLLTHHSWSNVDQREVHHKRWVVMLSEIRDHLAVSINSFKAAASTGAPRPTVEEVHGR
jgi:hypothetical protein